MSGKLIEPYVLLDPAEIEVGTRLRDVSESGVASVRASYAELGYIKDPIDVRRKKDGTLVLMAGGHRLTFAKEAGIQVPAKVWEGTNDWARIMEIDDNLAGSELTALDTAIFLAERKRIYEKLHPETRAGVAGGLARQGLAAELSSFADTTAEKLGVTPRQVRKIVSAGLTLNRDQVRWLRTAPRPVTLKDLQDLSKIGDDHERAQICIALTNGDAKSAAEAIRQRKGERPVKDPVDEALKALRQAWARAPKAAKRRFVAMEAAELDALRGDVITPAEFTAQVDEVDLDD